MPLKGYSQEADTTLRIGRRAAVALSWVGIADLRTAARADLAMLCCGTDEKFGDACR